MHVWGLGNVGEHSDQLYEAGVSHLNSGKSELQQRLRNDALKRVAMHCHTTGKGIQHQQVQDNSLP